MISNNENELNELNELDDNNEFTIKISTKYKNKCKTCGKVYSRKDSYNKHIILCEFLSYSKQEKTNIIEELDVQPTYNELIKIVQQLTIQHFNMKEQIKQLQIKTQNLKSSTISTTTNENLTLTATSTATLTSTTSTTLNENLSTNEQFNWLQSNIKPNISFEEWKTLSFEYINKDNFKEINKLNVLDFICNNVISIMINNNIIIPLFGFISKPNNLYIYSSLKWNKIKDEEISLLLKNYINHILSIIYTWYSDNSEEINKNNELDNLYKNINTKIFTFDYKNTSNILKFKKNVNYYINK